MPRAGWQKSSCLTNSPVIFIAISLLHSLPIPLAICLAQHAVALGCLDELDNSKKPFLLMPYMHSESALIHQEAERLFGQIGTSLDFELKHKAIIDRFGRYPHRNDVLGRPSTEEELAFLQQPGSSF